MLDTKQSAIAGFFRLESASGILLMFAAALAMILANSPLADWYDLFIDTPVQLRIAQLDVSKPLLLWINDGLMALFFFMVGLELKREVLEGELSELRKVILPGFGALGGMLFPALVYLAINAGDASARSGWAIPAATDIAFALGILSLLGSRVPVSVKIFLTSLAIFDDIGAIVIIAAFYTEQISLLSLLIAGISLQGVGMDQLMHGVPLGIALGLFLGKQLGVFSMCWLAIRLRLTELPSGMSWLTLYGTGLLCGIGFTMSLFIGSLAFESTGVNRLFDERLGILIGSLLSGITAYALLRYSLRPEKQ